MDRYKKWHYKERKRILASSPQFKMRDLLFLLLQARRESGEVIPGDYDEAGRRLVTIEPGMAPLPLRIQYYIVKDREAAPSS